MTQVFPYQTSKNRAPMMTWYYDRACSSRRPSRFHGFVWGRARCCVDAFGNPRICAHRCPSVRRPSASPVDGVSHTDNFIQFRRPRFSSVLGRRQLFHLQLRYTCLKHNRTICRMGFGIGIVSRSFLELGRNFTFALVCVEKGDP